MFSTIKQSYKPKYLVITPLKPGDKISKETKETIKRNKLPFDWVSFESDNNIPTNTTLALQEYEIKYPVPNYIIKVDNDINADRELLDAMYYTLRQTDKNIGYVYCAFSYIKPDGKKISFGEYFNEQKLLKQNYISSNSMIKRGVLRRVGGFVTDSKYERLLDWCLWLKMLYYGHKGHYLTSKGFTTPLNEGNVSNRGVEDYQLKYKRVIQDFVSTA